MRKFGKYPEIPTANESYDDGFLSGSEWDHVRCNWVPGGPMAFHVRDCERHDQDWVWHCYTLQENAKEWKRGWQDGVKWKSAETNISKDRD